MNKKAVSIRGKAVCIGSEKLEEVFRENPYMGTPLSSRFDDLDTTIRYLVIHKQMVFYEVTEDYVEIIRVLDGRTDYLSRLFD